MSTQTIRDAMVPEPTTLSADGIAIHVGDSTIVMHNVFALL